MKSFFKPTKITWIIFSVLTILFLGTISLWLLEVNIFDSFEPILFGIYAVTVLLPSGFIIEMGLPFAEYTSAGWWRFPEPTIVGWIIVAFLNFTVYYLFACIVSKIWYSVKAKFKDVEPPKI